MGLLRNLCLAQKSGTRIHESGQDEDWGYDGWDPRLRVRNEAETDNEWITSNIVITGTMAS